MALSFFEKRREARAEIGVEEIFFGVLGSMQEIAALHG